MQESLDLRIKRVFFRKKCLGRENGHKMIKKDRISHETFRSILDFLENLELFDRLLIIDILCHAHLDIRAFCLMFCLPVNKLLDGNCTAFR